MGRVLPASGSSVASASGKEPNRAALGMSYRKFFAERFAQFLRENFQSSVHVAVCFNVSAKTAENWWAGMNAPSGYAVAQAFTDPALAESAKKHLGAT